MSLGTVAQRRTGTATPPKAGFPSLRSVPFAGRKAFGPAVRPTNSSERTGTMASNNHVTLSGNLTADPTLHTAESGTARCSLRLAVSSREKTATGYQNRPSYFDVTIFGASAEQVAENFAKGDKIAVEGRLRWRQWTAADGGKRQSVEIVADTIDPPTRTSETAAA